MQIDMNAARWMMGECMTAAKQHGQGQRFHLYADWLSVTGYEGMARERLTKWVLDERSEIATLAGAIAETNFVMKMGMSIAQIVITLSGFKYDLVSTREELDELIRAQIGLPTGASGQPA